MLNGDNVQQSIVRLDYAALCLDDETIFDVREWRCPVCDGERFVLVAQWLKERDK